jgi:hypothetical protein
MLCSGRGDLPVKTAIRLAAGPPQELIVVHILDDARNTVRRDW